MNIVLIFVRTLFFKKPNIAKVAKPPDLAGRVEIVSAFVVAFSGSGRVGLGGSIDMATAMLGTIGAVVGAAPSVGETVGANNTLAFDGLAELVDCLFSIKRVGGRVGRASLEEFLMRLYWSEVRAVSLVLLSVSWVRTSFLFVAAI